MIASALDRLDTDGGADVIIVARGGGSLEDLWPFNEEIVARAVFRSRIPVVSGVGHETDFTITDYVADRRAPTPSAAAELVVPDGDVLRQTLLAWSEQAQRGVLRAVEASRAGVATLSRRLDAGLPDLGNLRRQVDDVAEVMGSNLGGRLTMARLEVDGLESRLRTLDPAATLRRGFAMVQLGESGGVVSSVSQVSGGESLAIRVADGSFPATAGNDRDMDASAGISQPENSQTENDGPENDLSVDLEPADLEPADQPATRTPN